MEISLSSLGFQLSSTEKESSSLAQGQAHTVVPSALCSRYSMFGPEEEERYANCDNLVTGVQSMTVHPDLLQLAHNSSLYPSADEHCCKFGWLMGNSR